MVSGWLAVLPASPPSSELLLRSFFFLLWLVTAGTLRKGAGVCGHSRRPPPPPQCRYQAATQPQLDFPLGHSYCRCDGNPTPVAFYIKHLVVFSLESPFCICFPVVRKLGSYPSHPPDYKWWSHALYSRCAGLPPPPPQRPGTLIPFTCGNP